MVVKRLSDCSEYATKLYGVNAGMIHWNVFGIINPLSAGNAFKRIHTVFPQLKFDRN